MAAGPALDTERLRLRRWNAHDRAPFASINADPRVMEHFPSLLEADASDQMIDRIERHFDDHGFGLWAVVTKADSRFIGFCGLAVPTFVTSFTPTVEIGWRLAHEQWGRGYATEAARAVLAFGFDTAGLERILSWAVPANQRSIQVMLRIGLGPAPELDFDHPGLMEDDRLRRHVVYWVTREEWLHLRLERTP